MINWIKKVFFNEHKKSDWTVINNNGRKTVISPEVMEFFNSKLPSPEPQDLKDLIDETEKIIISERIIEVGRYELKTLIVLDNSEQIKIAGQKLDILSEPQGHLLDGGHYMFDFVTKNEENHRIEYMGSVQIRWKEKWKEDAKLKDHVGLLEWLQDLGIDKPLREYNKAAKEEEKYVIQQQNWENKAPRSIIESIDKGYGYEYDKVYFELEKEFSNEKDLILNLLELYGCGFSVWNGYPYYEAIPEGILQKFSIESFLKIGDISEFTREQKHGMARFLCSSDFSKKRKSDIDKLPLKLKNLLLEHLIELGDEDKINEFKSSVLINEYEP